MFEASDAGCLLAATEEGSKIPTFPRKMSNQLLFESAGNSNRAVAEATVWSRKPKVLNLELLNPTARTQPDCHNNGQQPPLCKPYLVRDKTLQSSP